MKRHVVRFLGIGVLTLALIGCSDNENGATDATASKKDSDSTEVSKDLNNDSALKKGVEDFFDDKWGDVTYIKDITSTDGNVVVNYFGTVEDWNRVNPDIYGDEDDFENKLGLNKQWQDFPDDAIKLFISFPNLNSITFAIPEPPEKFDDEEGRGISVSSFERDKVNAYLLTEDIQLEDLTMENYRDNYILTISTDMGKLGTFFDLFTTIVYSDYGINKQDNDSTQVHTDTDSALVQAVEDFFIERASNFSFIKDISSTNGNVVINYFGDRDDWNEANPQFIVDDDEIETRMIENDKLFTREAIKLFVLYPDLNSITFNIPELEDWEDPGTTVTHIERDELNKYLGTVLDDFKLEDLTLDNYFYKYLLPMRGEYKLGDFYDHFTYDTDDIIE